MSFWNPYENDTVLDLSKPKVIRYVPQYEKSFYEPFTAAMIPYSPVTSPNSNHGTSFTSSPPLSSPDCDDRSTKAPRPFKVLATPLPVPEVTTNDPEYAAFRASMLAAIRARNGGSLIVTNPRMRRSVSRNKDTSETDYLERRARNNAAAKRSRDLRKLKAEELAIRASYLQQKLLQMETQLYRSCPSCSHKPC